MPFFCSVSAVWTRPVLVLDDGTAEVRHLNLAVWTDLEEMVDVQNKEN